MNSMTAEQINDYILEQYGEDEGFYLFAEKSKPYGKDLTYDQILENLKLEFVEDNSESEYDSYGNLSETFRLLFKHKESGEHFMLTGTYESYDGTDYDGFKKVNKVEKTIQVWQ